MESDPSSPHPETEIPPQEGKEKQVIAEEGNLTAEQMDTATVDRNPESKQPAEITVECNSKDPAKSVYERLTFEELKQVQQKVAEHHQIFVQASSQCQLEPKKEPTKLHEVEVAQENQFPEIAVKDVPEVIVKQVSEVPVKQVSEALVKQVLETPEETKTSCPQIKVYENYGQNSTVQPANVLTPATVFVRVKSQEVKFLNNKFQPIVEEVTQEAPQQNSLRQPKSKLAVTSNINLSINPCSKQNQQNKVIESQQEIAKDTQKISIETKAGEEAPAVKIEPLDIKSLSVLSLSSPEATKSIRPPSPKGQRKLKFWQIKKKIKPAEQTTVSEPSTASVELSASFIADKSGSVELKQTKKESSEDIPKDSQIQASGNSLYGSFQVSTTSPHAQTVKIFGAQEEELKKQFPYLRSFTPVQKSLSLKTQDKKEGQQKPKFPQEHSEGEHLLEGHVNRSNHPLLRFHSDPFKEEQNGEKIAKIQVQTPKLGPLSKQQPREELQLQKKQMMIKQELSPLPEAKIEELAERPLSEKLSISSNSVFDDDKLALQLERKRRLQELQIQIKQRRKIRDQLSLSTPLGVKLLLSAVTGSIIGGSIYLLKKKKLSSLLLGVASGVSAFLLTK